MPASFCSSFSQRSKRISYLSLLAPAGYALTLSGGTLTIREAVRKNPYYNNLLVRPALDVNTLTVSGGTLYAAWYWGEFTPIVFPIDDYYGYADPLVEMKDSSSSATFTGGTTTLLLST